MQKPTKLFDGIVKYLTALIILTIPLYPKFPFLKVSGTYVSVRLEDFIMAIAAIVVAIYYLPKIKKLFKDKIVRAILIFVFVGFVSTLSAILLTKTVVTNVAILNWARRIEYFIPFFLALIAVERDKKNLDFFLKLFLVVIVFVFIYGFGQRYFDWPIVVTQNEEYSKGIALHWVPGGHINSTFAGHYDLATYLVLVLPIIISLFFTVKNKLIKSIFILTFISGVWLITNAASRISVVSYLLAVGLTLIILRKFKALAFVLFVTIVLSALTPNLLGRYSNILEVTEKGIKVNKILYNLSSSTVYAADSSILIKREGPTITPTPMPILEDRSTSIRLNVEWPRAIRALTKNPFLGTGYSSITLATDNDYLRLLGETGILGFLSFFLLIGGVVEVLFTNLLKNIKKTPTFNTFFLTSVVGALPGVFLNALFIDIFEASKFAFIFWLVIGLAVAGVRNYQNE